MIKIAFGKLKLEHVVIATGRFQQDCVKPDTLDVLKRGSSVLDNNGGSFGPIRRTRQKSPLMSSSHRDSSPYRATSLSPDAGNGKSTYPFATIGHVPPQSTEMAMKIFQELGKLVPSPSEKLPKKKGKSTREDGDAGNSVTSATIVKSGREMIATPISFPAATSEKEPDVQKTMVQESVGLDAKHSTDSASGLSIAGSDELLRKPLTSFSNS